MKLYISISMHKLLLYSFIYFSITYALFTLTTGGWQALFFIYFSIFFWILLIIILSIGLLIRWKITRNNLITINTEWLKLLLIIQFFAILLNHSDCGDNPGSYSFLKVLFYRLSGTGKLCMYESPDIIYTLSIFFLLAYLTMLILVLIGILLQTRVITGVKKS